MLINRVLPEFKSKQRTGGEKTSNLVWRWRFIFNETSMTVTDHPEIKTQSSNSDKTTNSRLFSLFLSNPC